MSRTAANKMTARKEGKVMGTRRNGQSLILVMAVFCAILTLAAIPLNVVSADEEYPGIPPYKELAAEWWKWALSIPCTQAFCPNPLFDNNGDYCAVGQHGDVWFLAGSFGGNAERYCPVPEGMPLFFPVLNCVQFDSPNACGQGPESLSVKELRSNVAACIVPYAYDLSATLNGKPLKMKHVQSVVFEVALPKDNLFGDSCARGVYSPSVDEGYYVVVPPLKPGSHTIIFHADDFLEVKYYLTVVPVKMK